jgi:hypothetical protein
VGGELVVVGGAFLIAGGRTAGRAQNEVWELDVAVEPVTRMGQLPYAVSDMAAAVVGGIGYPMGGEGVGPVASIITVRVH